MEALSAKHPPSSSEDGVKGVHAIASKAARRSRRRELHSSITFGQWTKDCSGARQLRDADLSSKHARRRQATACRRDCASHNGGEQARGRAASTGPSAGPAPATGVASAPGVNVQETTYEAGPVRAVRSRHASPTGVAPVRLILRLRRDVAPPTSWMRATSTRTTSVSCLQTRRSALDATRAVDKRPGFPPLRRFRSSSTRTRKMLERRRRSVDCLDISVGKPCLPPQVRGRTRDKAKDEKEYGPFQR